MTHTPVQASGSKYDAAGDGYTSGGRSIPGRVQKNRAHIEITVRVITVFVSVSSKDKRPSKHHNGRDAADK